ncbi:AMMECR1 domain-containing protein [Candidatus Woesearchaeota archaeon B3_Woes]|nr:MAG: AMMECR1 domain-containing protein [Candidatus Woesearchaeota archaeon B3_Woes]
MVLNQGEGKELIKLARQSINSYFSDSDLKISEDIKKRFLTKQGVFVTLNLNKQLRGCIGFPEPTLPLYKAVSEAAQSAAFGDPRFNPLNKDEFKDVKIEMSVLSVPELIDVKDSKEYLDKIKIGEDGLIIRSEFGSGLLLPQVFAEYNCDVIKALEMTCQKANLSSDAWKDANTKVYKFQAQIFEE